MNGPLRPDETVQKLLISTPSRFVGELEDENFLLTHAWPDSHGTNLRTRFVEGPASRSAYVFAFRTDPIEKKKGVALPNWSPVGPMLCGYLSVLYGKRFDAHGLVEGIGHFYIPDQTHYQTLCDPDLPHNSHNPRKNLEVPLHLGEAKVLLPLMADHSIDPVVRQTFQTASKFYLQVLQNVESDPEVGYLHLITALEVVSNFYGFPEEDRFDDALRSRLAEVETLDNGSEISKFFKSRLYSIRRKVLLTVRRLVDAPFYEGAEVRQAERALDAEGIERRILAAYDLRSKYVHSGAPFGSWVTLFRGSEVMLGRPVVEDNGYATILERAPTFAGLERLVRYVVLRFVHTNGVFINRNLGATDI